MRSRACNFVAIVGRPAHTSKVTAIIAFLAILVLVDVAVGVRTWRLSRPLGPPESHRAWTVGNLPSRPYTMAR